MLILANDCLNGLLKLFNFGVNLYITRRRNLISMLKLYVLFFSFEMRNETLFFLQFYFPKVSCNLSICLL